MSQEKALKMLKFELDSFVTEQPRKKDKKKRHSRGFSEDIQDKRAQRLSFKKYVRKVEEELEQYDDDLDDSF